MNKVITTVAFIMLLLAPCVSYGQSGDKENSEAVEQTEQKSDGFYWEADLGLLLSFQKILIPDVYDEDESLGLSVILAGGAYYDNFFVEASPLSGRPLTFGYSLYSQEDQQVNIIAESLFFELSEEDREKGSVLDGIRDRESSMEFGIEYFAIFKKFDVRFKLMHDGLNKHNGSLASFEISRPLFTRHVLVMPGIAVYYIDDNAANYYYGVSQEEVSDVRPAYEATSSIFATARLYLERPINDDWSLVSSASYTAVSSGVSDSPILRGRNSSYSFNVGVLWTF
ncbi:MAG: MipA/OmpV family protein [Thalassotalea sp.]|nr:MipA/OmpV family protein [Thalassotalea sp.]